jgi:hypothetical protein
MSKGRLFRLTVLLVLCVGFQSGCPKDSSRTPELRLGQPVTGVAAWPINVIAGQTYTGFVANVTVCRGFSITFSEVTIDWRDGSSDPVAKTTLNAGAVNASHLFSGAGQYTIWISGYAKCVNGDSTWNDLFQGTGVVNAYLPIAVASIKLVPAMIPRNSFSLKNTVTLCSPALPWYSLASVTSSNPAIAKIFAGGVVGVTPGKTAQFFRIDTAGLTGTVTITVTAGGVTKSLKLKVI